VDSCSDVFCCDMIDLEGRCWNCLLVWRHDEIPGACEIHRGLYTPSSDGGSALQLSESGGVIKSPGYDGCYCLILKTYGKQHGHDDLLLGHQEQSQQMLPPHTSRTSRVDSGTLRFPRSNDRSSLQVSSFGIRVHQKRSMLHGDWKAGL
jgi:hypothetical protein